MSSSSSSSSEDEKANICLVAEDDDDDSCSSSEEKWREKEELSLLIKLLKKKAVIEAESMLCKRSKQWKEVFLINKQLAHWRNNTRIRSSFYLFSISVSKFFPMINCLLINVMYFNLFLFMVKKKNYKIKFLTAVEKQPIVSSKQPIVLSPTALCRNWFNCFLNFLAVADIFQRENLGKGSVLKADHVQKGFTTVIKEYIPKSRKLKSFND